jgi:hypothetical protein
MNRRTDRVKGSDSPPQSAQSTPSEQAKPALPIEFDDILAVAIVDSVLRVKHRRLRGRSGTRRPKSV